VTNPTRARGIPQIGLLRTIVRAASLTVVLTIGAPAVFAAGDEPASDADADAIAAPAPAERVAELTDPAAQVAASDAAASDDADKDKKWSASLGIETSIGIGTFVTGDQNQSSVSTTFAPSFSYQVADKLAVGASFSLTWFQVLDFVTPLADNTVLMSDIGVSLSHASIYKHEDSGFNLAGGLSLGLPTSLASQFQNRLFSLKPSLTASIPVGPVKFSYTFGFGKYFNTTATSTVNCDNFDHPDECRQGRDANPDFGFESERRGPEVYLPGSGSSSFYFQNSLSVRWAIIEGLNLALGVGIYNNFGTRSLPADEFTGEGATAGRSQSDRLVSSLALSYQVIKQLEVGASLVTATTHPFGDQGNSFVFFDFSRAPDNITSLNFSVTGSL
jgi:hypothetical protein